MADKVLMLALSPTMETGTIVDWNKKEGDQVSEGDILCEVETDKATMEYESQNEGILLKIVVSAGQEAAVGQAIALIGEKGEDIGSLLEEIERDAASAPAAGEPEKKTAEVEVVSSQRGTASQAVEEAPAPRAQAIPASGAPAPEAAGAAPPGGVKASPVARRLSEQHGIDMKGIQGSGPEGRIVKRDVEKALETGGAAAPRAAPARTAPGAGIAIPAYTPGEMTVTKIPVSGKRKVIAQRLSESMFSAPHYYLRTIVAVDDLFKARKELNSRVTDKVSFNAFLIKFVAEALRRHPVVNAGWQGDHIFQYGRADIGLAVAQADGLITPIVRDCWNRGILSIDAELKVLIDRALINKLKPEEFQGATFTISNLGSYGIHDFTAVINPPGSAILAVGEARREPVIGANDQVEVRTNMVLSLSCDHRVIDGDKGALFMQDLKALMEDPIQALY
jgi:pyruvate dehydrogenase E2 component (dihydrolipoamide acetyltransferase)